MMVEEEGAEKKSVLKNNVCRCEGDFLSAAVSEPREMASGR